MKYGIIYRLSCMETGKFIIGSTLLPKDRKRNHIGMLRRRKHYNKELQFCYNESKSKNFQFEIIRTEIPEEILKNIEDIYIGSLCSKWKDNNKGLNLIGSNESFLKAPVYQYDINGKFLAEWECMSLAANHLTGYSKVGNITKVCDKKSVSSYGFIWRRAKDMNYIKDNLVESEIIAKRGIPRSIVKSVENLYLKGLKLTELAIMHNICRQRVKSIIKKAGLKRNKNELKKCVDIEPLYLE